MPFPQIGLQAVLVLQQFQANAKKYDSMLRQMQTQTQKTATGIKQSTVGMSGGLQQTAGAAGQAAGGLSAAGTSAAATGAQFAMLAGTTVAVVTGVMKVTSAMYDMAEAAAPVVDVRRSYVALAASSGIAADQLLADLQRVSRGTVDSTQLIQTANRALLAGGAQLADQLPKLYEIAEAAARATGVNQEYVFKMLLKGIVKASPRLIDEAEIYFNIGKAVDDYAASLGRSTEQLSVQERQVAILNAVLEQGEGYLGRFGAQAGAMTDPFRQSDVAARQLKAGIGELLLPTMQRLAKGVEGVITAFKFFVANAIAVIEVGKNIGGVLSGSVNALDVYREKFDATYRILSGSIPKSELLAGGLGDLGEAAKEAARQTEELNQKLADLAEKRLEKLADLEIQFSQRWEDIEIQRARQIEDAQRQLGYQLEDMARDYDEKIEDIHADHSDKLQDIERDKQKRLQEYAKDAHKARRDLERQHIERLQAIQQSYYDTVEEAARSNDAVAIARAMRQRARELRDAEQAKGKEQAELSEQLAEKKEQLTTALSEERVAEQERYREALAAAEEQREKQLESLRISLQRQEEERQIAWRRQEEDFERAKQRQMEAIDRWYSQEKEKLTTQLAEMTALAVEGVQQAGAQIAAATAEAARAVATAAISTVGMTRAEQWGSRHEYMGAEETPTPSWVRSEQWRRRHTYFRAAGGIDLVTQPTHFVAGDAGPEVAAFFPVQGSLNHNFGGLDVNFHGLPAQMESNVESIVYGAMVQMAHRLARRAAR